MNLTKKISITILDELMLNGSVDEKNYKKTIYGLEIVISALTQIVGLVIIGMFMGILDKMITVAFSHKPMTEKGRRKNRKRSIMILLTLLSIAICVYTISSIDKLYPA